MLRKVALSGFSPSPLLVLWPRRVWADSCSLGTGAVLVLAGAGNLLQTWSPLGRRQKGPEKSLCAMSPEPQFPPARQDPPRAHLRKSTKLASDICIRESETLLGKPSSAPMRVCSGKQRLRVSTLGQCLPKSQGCSGLPPAPWALVLCWCSLELETNSKRALLWGQGGCCLKRPCVYWPKHPTFH